MKQITDEQYELFTKLVKIWYHSDPEKSGSFFICGEGGEHDNMGLPKNILVCPSLGSDDTVIYTRGKADECK